SWTVIRDADLRAIVYREILGLPRDRLDGIKTLFHEWRFGRVDTPTCRAGISPHAPYSVNESLFLFAAKCGLPFSMHLAETTAELQLLASHRGPFVDFLTELAVWDPIGLVPSVDFILKRTRRAVSPVYVHGNYLRPDAPFLASGTVVYCPRTHAAFGHSPHPFRQFLARGVCVALGTDSLASNPDLSVLAEARFVHSRDPDLPGATLLRMATLSGAEALGWAGETGSLEPGKSADFAVVELPPRDEADPHALLFASDRPVRATWFRG